MMDNVTETNAAHEDSPAGTPGGSLGSMLREVREQLGLSVMDISSQIKFAPRQIEALEANDFAHLPETAFLRGFVRSYAKVLHLDAELLLAALPQKKAAATELAPESVKEPSPDVRSVLQQNSTWLAGAMVVFVIVAAFALWHFRTPSEPMKVAQVESPVTLPVETPASSAQPAPETVAPPELPPIESPKMQAQKTQLQKAQQSKVQPAKAPPSAAMSSVPAASTVASPAKKKQTVTSVMQGDLSSPVASLRLEFSEDSWAEIKDKDGKILSSRTHTAGSELRVSGHPPLSVLIGHAPTVRLFYGDKQVDLAPHTRRSTGVASLTLE